MAILPSFNTIIITCQPDLYYNTYFFITLRRRADIDGSRKSVNERRKNLSRNIINYSLNNANNCVVQELCVFSNEITNKGIEARLHVAEVFEFFLYFFPLIIVHIGFRIDGI